MYTVSPKMHECFCMRLLLLHVRGPTSFEDLRRYEDEVLPTFEMACRARGLFENDGHWRMCMQEADLGQMPIAMRRLFSIILIHGRPTHVMELWQEFKSQLSADFKRRNRNLSDAEAEDCALQFFANKLHFSAGLQMKDVGMPAPTRQAAQLDVVNDVGDQPMLDDLADRMRMLNPEQRAVFNAVINAVDNGGQKLHFLDAPGGTGKTFLLQLLIGHVRQQGGSVLGVASSGIAATLLPQGQTAHSMFRIPVATVRR